MPPSPPHAMSRRTLLASAMALAAGCAVDGMGGPEPGGSPAARMAEPLVLAGARVGLPSGEVTPATVVVAEGRIAAVEPAGAAVDGRVLGLRGATLLPGFIDSHVHLQFADAADILAGGVTTVRDLGCPGEEREAAAATALGVVFAGRILTPVGGYPTRSWGGRGESREVADAADAVRAVDEQLSEGATVIKVALEERGGPLFDADVMAAIVGAAHDADVAVTAHVGSSPALRLALEVGVDELAHLPLHDVTPAEMEEVAAAGLALCPTMVIRGRDPDGVRALAAFVAAGGRVLYATDLGNGGTTPGIMVAEVAAMLEAGMAPEAVLAAATSVPADHHGLPDRGRIADGAAADLIAVAGDPLVDPGAYADLRLVLVAGTVARRG